MRRLKKSVSIAALMVLLICIYAFLLGNGVFNGEFQNEYIAWYFLAKGIFCSIALYLWAEVLEILTDKKDSKEKKS